MPTQLMWYHLTRHFLSSHCIQSLDCDRLPQMHFYLSLFMSKSHSWQYHSFPSSSFNAVLETRAHDKCHQPTLHMLFSHIIHCESLSVLLHTQFIIVSSCFFHDPFGSFDYKPSSTWFTIYVFGSSVSSSSSFESSDISVVLFDIVLLFSFSGENFCVLFLLSFRLLSLSVVTFLCWFCSLCLLKAVFFFIMLSFLFFRIIVDLLYFDCWLSSLLFLFLILLEFSLDLDIFNVLFS